MTIKFWGTTHTDSTCCWCMTTLNCNGNTCFGGEGPHPSTTTCQQNSGNVGNVSGKLVGFKGVIWALANGGAHQEIWVDTTANGNWRKIGERNVSACGKTKTTTKPVPNQQVEFRTDCTGVNVRCAWVAEIKPPTGTKTTVPLGVTKIGAVATRLRNESDCGYYPGDYEHYVLKPQYEGPFSVNPLLSGEY